jgi:uncharacterized protein (DUF2267 family)
MPMPFNYRTASRDFEKFIEDLRQLSLLQTSNQSYTEARSVFHVFRNHVAVQVALDFANALPAVLRAIFIEDWDISRPIKEFPPTDQLLNEVFAIRPDHNVSAETAITDVALALRMNMNPVDFEQMLATLPPRAAAFWRPAN